MTTGKNHDRIGHVSTAILGLAAFSLLPSGDAIALTIGSAMGYLYLSPDVDTLSRPVRRWGLLASIWAPLQALTKHRGITHVPVLGAIAIQAYLSIFLFVGVMIAYALGVSIEKPAIPEWAIAGWWWFTIGQIYQQLLHLAGDYWPY